MNIKDLESSTQYIIFTTESYYESTGYEREGDFGSRREYVYPHQFNTIEAVQNWILSNPNKEFKLFAMKNLTVKKTVTIDLDINHG